VLKSNDRKLQIPNRLHQFMAQRTARYNYFTTVNDSDSFT
jgi:hypothetical protein